MWLVILLPWFVIVYWYFCTMICPNCFDGISQNMIEKQSIEQKSILNKLYIRKNVFPKIRIVAMELILFISITMICNVCESLIYWGYNIKDIAIYISIINCACIFIVGTATIIYLNVKK